jgi:hypothetical protein
MRIADRLARHKLFIVFGERRQKNEYRVSKWSSYSLKNRSLDGWRLSKAAAISTRSPPRVSERVNSGGLHAAGTKDASIDYRSWMPT